MKKTIMISMAFVFSASCISDVHAEDSATELAEKNSIILSYQEERNFELMRIASDPESSNKTVEKLVEENGITDDSEIRQLKIMKMAIDSQIYQVGGGGHGENPRPDPDGGS